MNAPVMESEPRSKIYSFRVLTRQLQDLKRIQKKTGATIGEQVRRGIDLWIAKQGKVA